MAKLHGEYITVTKAAEILGVNGTLIRRELKRHLDDATGESNGGRLSGYMLNERTWLVCKGDVDTLRRSLGWKAGQPRDAKKPAAKAAKKAAKGKKS